MSTQEERHKLGRTGEKLANGLLNGKTTAHKAPFDIVDFTSGFAYEVKAMSNLSKDFKVHITEKSMTRKVKFAEEYELEMLLVVVVVHGPGVFELYWGRLQQSVRISQLIKVRSI